MIPRARPLRLLIAALALASCAAVPAPEPRAQRSANLSHITGTSRKIQMFLKNRYLQLWPDGTVNGTTDGNSEHTILQRATYKVGLLTIQGVYTCLYLCMDACGFHYAHDLSDDCLFAEHLEENNYNTYSRIRNGKKTFLALDNRGRSRRTQIPVSRQLGNLSTYALTLTKRWDGHGHKPTQCPPRRHRGKIKRPPPRHRNCMMRIQKQNLRHKRKHKKVNIAKKKRHPKARRKHENGTTTTTEMYWDESTMSTISTTDVEFFRSATAQEAVTPS
ncbi:fibroblast growth factor 22 isoform X2 [Plodia interpunctella]|uniref:fibroblast growth factor 22 isoform X2 n=1 Tax=Plodia interpunctella TaxID=58824 RepID=UPI002367BC64|nr:fibroblast growth factor 22 isoform X2 [Plodia interpunctella]